LNSSSFPANPGGYCIAWAKNEPPSPTDSDRDQHPSSPSTSGSSEARRADIDYTPRGPPGGEHRWFPFTRHLPLLPTSELFTGATGESSPTRLEKRPAIFRTPSSLREAYTAALSEKNAESGPSRKPGLRITMPTPPSTPYTLSRNQTPGWDSPWAPKPLESLFPQSISEQLQNGRSSKEQDDSIITERWWPRTRKRARAYLLNNTYVPLVQHSSVRFRACSADRPLAFSVRQYHVYSCGTCHCHSNTTSREALQCCRHPWHLTVRDCACQYAGQTHPYG
jgi:hypothetical protein